MLTLALTPIDRYVGRFVSDIRLKQILEYPMVFLGTSPFSAPALYSLMSALDFRQGVFYPQGGMYTIIERMMAISQKCGVTYHFNSPVDAIVTSRGHATGIRLEDTRTIDADTVVSNADLHFTETTLLSPADRSYPASYWDKQQAGPSALLMYLGIQGKLPDLEHHNLLFVDDWKGNFEAIYGTKTLPESASIYICKPSGIDPSVAPRSDENVFVLVPLPPGTSLTTAELEKVSVQYLEQIAIMTKQPDLQKRIVFMQLFGPDDFVTKFHSWQATALGPSHVLRQSAMFRTPNKSKRLDNLYYVGGSTTPGIGLPMCLIGAELVYKRLARDTRGGTVDRIERIGDKD
jgi:phytoene desaturase